MVDGGRSCAGKIWVQIGRLPWENSGAVQILPHNSETAIDTGKSTIDANRKSTMGFPMNHQRRSCVTPNFPKTGFRYPNLAFSQNFEQKVIKVCYIVLLSKSSSSDYLSNGINTLPGNDLVPVQFEPKGTDPQQEGCAFARWRHTRHAVHQR